MGARGPLPEAKPTVNFRPGVPSAPSWLDPVAKREYKRVVRLLAERPGHLQQVDMAVLCTYAQGYSDVVRLTLDVRREGESLSGAKGGSYLNPKCSALAQAHNRMREAQAKLGFSPGDRARTSAKGVRDGAPSPLAGFIAPN